MVHVDNRSPSLSFVAVAVGCGVIAAVISVAFGLSFVRDALLCHQQTYTRGIRMHSKLKNKSSTCSASGRPYGEFLNQEIQHIFKHV